LTIGSQNPTDMGTIRREGPGLQRCGQWEPSETLRSGRATMKLEAQWIVGFVDGEGCFYVGINPHAEMSASHQVLPEFTVVQHEKDVQILHALKAHFGCGVVRRNHGDRMAYRVRSKEHLLQRILPFFMKHSLKTKKNVEFLKFRDVLLLMENNDHLTAEGVEKIRAIAGAMNRGAPR
jgi:LAGLIDADG endonuclease